MRGREAGRALIDRKQVHMDALGLRVDSLCFWNEITTGDITTKEERKAAFLATKPKGNRLSFLPEELSPKTEEELIWDEEFECLEMERIPRKFPATNVVYHFHPIAFAQQMGIICGDGGKLKSVLDKMKELVDKHIPYSQLGERSSLSEEGMAALDCSETVGIYLHKLGCMPKYKAIHTGIMTTEVDFRKAIGSNKIQLVEGSDKTDFIPEPGDIFVWRRKRVKKENGKDIVTYDGHTGIVYSYDSSKDVVTILEAIGKWGASGESKQIANGGDSNKGCTRTAKYGRLDGALCGHKGWIGYFRPVKY